MAYYLSNKCAELKLTVSSLSRLIGVDRRTLRGWIKTRPELIRLVLLGIENEGNERCDMYIVLMRDSKDGQEYLSDEMLWEKHKRNSLISDYKIYNRLNAVNEDIAKLDNGAGKYKYYIAQLAADKNGKVSTIFYS